MGACWELPAEGSSHSRGLNRAILSPVHKKGDAFAARNPVGGDCSSQRVNHQGLPHRGLGEGLLAPLLEQLSWDWELMLVPRSPCKPGFPHPEACRRWALIFLGLPQLTAGCF